MSGWRHSAAADFATSKHPATAHGGMVVSNHHLASLAGAEMLAVGGNAVDATVATLFALTVVEPMMVGIWGGGMSHIRLANGKHVVIDGQAQAPIAARPDMFTPISDAQPHYLETVGRENAVGAKAVAAPGSLAGWCHALKHYGTLPLADVMAPAIRLAEHGFPVTAYLSDCIAEASADLGNDKLLAALYLPGGNPLKAGARLIQGTYADTLKTIAKQGSAELHGGALGLAVIDYLVKQGSEIQHADLKAVRIIEREPVRGHYRGHEIVGPPPPSSGGVHIIQMLKILEGFDIKALGFGSSQGIHLLAEVLKIAFADRKTSTADPAFVDVPVDALISAAYAEFRRAQIDHAAARSWSAGLPAFESAHTTHVTVADRHGNVVASTQTINSTFGARMMVADVGIIPNNYMATFDPHPGNVQSISTGKRISTSMSPVMLLRDNQPVLALGLPGGLRIFGSVMLAISNFVDHGMSVQEMVEAPRVWTQGDALEIESGIDARVCAELRELGHDVVVVAHVGGGMNAIEMRDDGTMIGAACWRADGTAVGLGGGRARADARFWPDARPAETNVLNKTTAS